MRRILLLFPAFLLAAAGWVLAGEAPVPRRPLPASPPDGVLDDAKLLDPGQVASLRRAVVEFREHQKSEAAFAAFTVPQGESAREAADHVRAGWFQDRPAVVIVYSRRDQALGLSHSGFLEEKLTSPELMAVIREAGAILGPAGRPEREIGGAEVTCAAAQLFRSLDQALTRVEERGRPPSVARIVIYLGYVALGVLALALPVILVFRRKMSHHGHAHEAWHFPEVKQPARLGGSRHGGGGVTLDHTSGKAE